MKHKIFDKTMIRFLLVGVINTLVGTGIMFLFYNLLHMGYWVSSAANYVVGSIVSYFLNKYYTFTQKKRSGKELLRFIINITLCYLLAYGLAKPAVNLALTAYDTAVRENLAMVVGMGLFVVLNYVGQRFFVFRSNTVEADKVEGDSDE